jgi:acetyl-CoA synthetase
MKTVEGYQPKDEFSKKALIDTKKYQEMYKKSVENPEAFWQEQARNLVLWQKQFSKVKNV